MRAGRFLYMPEMLPQRGAATGGERRLHGAARSMAAQQADRRCVGALGHLWSHGACPLPRAASFSAIATRPLCGVDSWCHIVDH